MLKEDFVPVAIDQWYQRRQKDTEGEFYRKIASQGPRKDFEATTQGRYMAAPDGKLLAYNNNRGSERLQQLMRRSLARFMPEKHEMTPLVAVDQDPNRHIEPENETVVVRVHAKILSGYNRTNKWIRVFHDVVSQDNMWILEDELPELVEAIKNGGDVPERITKRIARFHLVDNTRGEPPRWSNDEIKSLKLSIQDGTIRGSAHLETKTGDRGYKAELLGVAELKDDKISRFDLVSKGDFWGQGLYTHHGPKGKFPLAITFQIVDGTSSADKIMPHGTKGWTAKYVESER